MSRLSPKTICTVCLTATAMTVCSGLVGCEQADNRFDYDAPRSRDFDPVEPEKIQLFENEKPTSLDLPAYEDTFTRVTPRPARIYDSQVKPAVAKTRRSNRKTQTVQPIQLAVYREGDDLRQNQLARLESSPPPELSLVNWMNSRPKRLTDLKGRIVVLDFWATWCQPCIQSISHNNAIAKKYKGQGVELIGICHPQGSENMVRVAQRFGIQYPIAIDSVGQTIASYQVNEYPDYYLIDRQGRLRLADCRNGSIEDAIKALLAEKQ